LLLFFFSLFDAEYSTKSENTCNGRDIKNQIFSEKRFEQMTLT
jgi:hypothetical protein